MKLKKILTLMCCAVLLVCISVGATVAYLTSTDKVQNTFTVGKVEITLDETDVKLDGTKDTDTRVKANEYKLMPGHSYIKDPVVTVKADSEPSHIRLLVTVTDLADLKSVFADSVVDGTLLIQNYVTGWDPETWLYEKVTEDKNTAVYEFRYKETVSTVEAGDLKLDALFDTIEIPGTVTNDQIALLEELEINVVAQAIQADGFASDDAAWAEFPTTAQ